jgi:hypothetical protein
MRWALVALALLLAVTGLLYRGGLAFVSSLSEATASRGVDGTGAATATTGQVEAPTRPDPSSAGPETATLASAASRANPAGSEPSPVSQPGVRSNPEDSSPSATEQRTFKSRKALETVDSREFLRQSRMPK